jgi:hypothetical protein
MLIFFVVIIGIYYNITKQPEILELEELRECKERWGEQWTPNLVHCHRDVLAKTLDPSICENIHLGIEGAYGSLHINGRNYGDDIYFCYKFIIQKTSDCYVLDHLDTRNYCLAMKNNDSSFCDKISEGKEKWICYADIAGNLNDKSLCYKIKYGLYIRDACIMDVVGKIENVSHYYDLVKSTKNASLCEELSHLKDVCYSKLAE